MRAACGATWVWAQRRALPTKVFLCSKIKELARRDANDESLPIARNGQSASVALVWFAIPVDFVLVARLFGVLTGCPLIWGILSFQKEEKEESTFCAKLNAWSCVRPMHYMGQSGAMAAAETLAHMHVCPGR